MRNKRYFWEQELVIIPAKSNIYENRKRALSINVISGLSNDLFNKPSKIFPNDGLVLGQLLNGYRLTASFH